MTNRMVRDTPVGPIGILEEEGRIVRLVFDGETIPLEDVVDRETDGLITAWRQLDEYFAGRRRAFELPLAPAGTPFYQRVWDELARIPFGETRSYAWIAGAVGNARACRAVGQAVNRNPVPIIIPCHRVIGSSGSLTGYRVGLPLKAQLLELENLYAGL